MGDALGRSVLMLLTASAVLAGPMACGRVTSPPGVASVVVSPDTVQLEVGGTRALAAEVLDGDGNRLAGRTVDWSSSDTTVATVSGAGVVIGVAEGGAIVRAMADGKRDSAMVTVLPIAVATVQVTPASLTVVVGGMDTLSVETLDRNGNVLPGRAVTWSSSDTTVVTVSAQGVLTGMDVGAAVAYAESEGVRDSSLVSVEAPGDNTSPVLTGFSLQPDTLDVTNASDTTEVTLEVTDTGSGVATALVQVRSPGADYQTQYCVGQLVSGTSQAGTYTCPIVIPQYSAAGEWYVQRVELTDQVGNINIVVEDSLQAAGFDTKFWVENVDADTTGPTLSAFTMDPDTLDVTNAADTTQLTLDVADTGTGVATVLTQVRSPGTDYQTRYCVAQLASGTSHAGTYTCQIVIPQYSAAGEWHVERVELTDQVGNSNIVLQDSMIAAGFNTKLWVNDADPDTVAPSLTGFTLSPDTLDVTNAADTADVTFQVTDAGTGVASVLVQMRSPGTDFQVQECSGQLVSGTPQAGTYTCRIVVPQGAAAGKWYAQRVELSDQIGNWNIVYQAAMDAAGFDTTIWVISN